MQFGGEHPGRGPSYRYPGRKPTPQFGKLVTEAGGEEPPPFPLVNQQIASVAVGTEAGPLVLKVRASVHAQVELKVNGQKVRHPFESTSAKVQQTELRARDGLRASANTLRLRSTRAAVVSIASCTVKVPGWALLANAGSDSAAYVGTHIRLGTQPLPTAGRAR